MLNRGYGSHITNMFQPGMFASNKQGASTPTNMPQSNKLQQQVGLLSGNFPTNPLVGAINGATGNNQNTWNWQGGEQSPYGIRTPNLGYQWHYGESGEPVPNVSQPNRMSFEITELLKYLQQHVQDFQLQNKPLY